MSLILDAIITKEGKVYHFKEFNHATPRHWDIQKYFDLDEERDNWRRVRFTFRGARREKRRLDDWEYKLIGDISGWYERQAGWYERQAWDKCKGILETKR